MDIVQDDTHDSLVATYLGLEFARLNEALKECGISDATLRRRICTTYFFNSAQFLDGGWFDEAGQRVQPGVYFTEVNDAEKVTGRAFLPDPDGGTMLHEYVHGTAIWLYEDHAEDVSAIEVGDVSGKA